MLSEYVRGDRSLGERQWGTCARLAMLVAALVLVIGSCGLADPPTKLRKDSMRGASWPGTDAGEVALNGVAVVHTGTPTPGPPFAAGFEPPPEDAEAPDGGHTPSAAPEPDVTLWPLPTPGGPEPEEDESGFEELDHTPEPDPGADPCDAVGVLPDECGEQPEPTPCAGTAEGCEPSGCAGTAGGCSPPDCPAEPTSGPTSPATTSPSAGTTPEPGMSSAPGPPGTSEPSAEPSQSAPASPTPEPPTTSPSPPEPPDGGAPGC